MTEVVASFEIRYTRFLDPAGRAVGRLPRFAEDAAALIPLYRGMVRTRRFDAKAIALQRTGRLGTFASSLGQEAVVVGLASAMRADDVLLPSYRETGAQLWRGVSLEELLLYWGGDERGSDFKGPRHDFPVSVPVASHCLHATGAAYAFKILREPRVAVCVCGDGATSNGAFYEAINCAGAWRVPAVFVVSNNQWAISVPRGAQTGAGTLAQKAIAAGIPGEQVDGNDVIAVH
ncbi:MAG: thiamine pyrophosphate-dependent enzyme, partial [Geminicoccales bacterium]